MALLPEDIIINSRLKLIIAFNKFDISYINKEEYIKLTDNIKTSLRRFHNELYEISHPGIFEGFENIIIRKDKYWIKASNITCRRINPVTITKEYYQSCNHLEQAKLRKIHNDLVHAQRKLFNINLSVGIFIEYLDILITHDRDTNYILSKE